jgi:hypothetical protein
VFLLFFLDMSDTSVLSIFSPKMLKSRSQKLFTKSSKMNLFF